MKCEACFGTGRRTERAYGPSGKVLVGFFAGRLNGPPCPECDGSGVTQPEKPEPRPPIFPGEWLDEEPKG